MAKIAKRSIDRRVVRTRATLHQALISLILRKGYEAITVEDLCAHANIGRSTFYAHYKSKEELHLSGMDHLRRQLVERQRNAAGPSGRPGERRLGFSLAMFEHARGRIDHYRAMAGGHSGAAALGHIRKLVADMVRDELATAASKNSGDAVPREIVVQYIVGAFMAVLTWWLDGGAKLPPERIDAIFRRLATDGVMPSDA
ncbi:MAG TPA: TetR/AcrR family transcriptional regulator [Stellaceae bacterium]|jgi:AcrR family transcriptional regulator|nr:TetR/AcrR family transcriptional regulator [Stellaceae bacterium]